MIAVQSAVFLQVNLCEAEASLRSVPGRLATRARIPHVQGGFLGLPCEHQSFRRIPKANASLHDVKDGLVLSTAPKAHAIQRIAQRVLSTVGKRDLHGGTVVLLDR